MEYEDVEQYLLQYMSKITYTHAGKKTIICCITAYNGFEVIGSSAPNDITKFDQELGEASAYSDALVKFSSYIAFLEHDRRYVTDFEDLDDECTCECDGSCRGSDHNHLN